MPRRRHALLGTLCGLGLMLIPLAGAVAVVGITAAGHSGSATSVSTQAAGPPPPAVPAVPVTVPPVTAPVAPRVVADPIVGTATPAVRNTRPRRVLR